MTDKFTINIPELTEPHRAEHPVSERAKHAAAILFGQANVRSKPPDAVNHPSHYTQGAIECIEAMKACATEVEFLGHLRLTALKYLWRCNDKGKQLEDLKKAQWYLNRLVAELTSPDK